jgi:hypothetical protein
VYVNRGVCHLGRIPAPRLLLPPVLDWTPSASFCHEKRRSGIWLLPTLISNFWLLGDLRESAGRVLSRDWPSPLMSYLCCGSGPGAGSRDRGGGCSGLRSYSGAAHHHRGPAGTHGVLSTGVSNATTRLFCKQETALEEKGRFFPFLCFTCGRACDSQKFS